jgi:hypothetical protein
MFEGRRNLKKSISGRNLTAGLTDAGLAGVLPLLHCVKDRQDDVGLLFEGRGSLGKAFLGKT